MLLLLLQLLPFRCRNLSTFSTARGLYLSCCSHVCCCLLQVRGASLSLLQHLALQHTARGELEELLVAGPAGAALLTAVGRALATQPALFVQLAQLVQVRRFDARSCDCARWVDGCSADRLWLQIGC
jgi:hypothetical protein